VRGLGVFDRVDQGDLVAAAAAHGPELVERRDRGTGDVGQRLLQLVLRDTELLRDLLVGGSAVELTLELGEERSMSRARARTERGTQSIARSSSMIEPLMRAIA